MKNLKFITLVIILLILNACSKEEASAVINGRILNGCSNMPVANYNMILREYKSNPIGKSTDKTIPFSTDKDGYFSVIHTATEYGAFSKSRGTLSITSVKGGVLVENITTIKDVNLGTLYKYSETLLYVYNIKTNNPYQLGDTLFYAGKHRSEFNVSAPFNDTIIPEIFEKIVIKNELIDNISTIDIRSNYLISDINQTTLKDTNFVLQLPLCSNQIDTITIEIN